ncbi:UbiD family decarboxylase domain-containing protein [Vibrio sp. DNB22_10_4]
MVKNLKETICRLETYGIKLERIEKKLSAQYEVASHYINHQAKVPGSQYSGDEGVCIYTNNNTRYPILMGLFGSRELNRNFIRECCKNIRDEESFIKPEIIKSPICQSNSLSSGLLSLPALKITPDDAGFYLTSGIVCAKNPRTNSFSSSIHRLKILDDSRLTLAMRPSGGLFKCYQEALSKNEKLPISINIGAPPIYYLLTSIANSTIHNDGCKISLMGGKLGYPVRLAKGATNDSYCFSDSEFVIEGEISHELSDESSSDQYSMPEFLGYMGESKKQIPVINITGILYQDNPIFQTFLGPGKEQSELLAIPTEVAIYNLLEREFDSHFKVSDVHLPTSGGGQLSVVVSIKRLTSLLPFDKLRKRIYQTHPLCKNIYIVDDDIDIFSPEDFLWALNTRFQPSKDMYLERTNGLPMDPSQTSQYFDGTGPANDLVLYDLTKPQIMQNIFQRYNVRL